MFPGDLEFGRVFHENGLAYVLCDLCGLNKAKDKQIISSIISVYNLKNSKFQNYF
jgi:hypothetical protein